MLYSMPLGMNDVQLHLVLCYLYYPVCDFTCYEEQLHSSAFGKGSTCKLFLLFCDSLILITG